MFFFARINVKQYQRPGIPNEIIQKFEKYIADKIMLTGRDRRVKFDSDEYSRDNGIQKHTRSPSTFVNNRRQLYQTAPYTAEAQMPRQLHYEPKSPYLTRSTSPNDPSSSIHFSERQMYGHHGYLGCRSSGGEISSSSLGMGYSPLPQEPIAHKDPMDMQPHQFNSQLHTSRVSPDPLHSHLPNLMGSSFSLSNPINVSLPPICSEDHFNINDYKHVCHTGRYDPSHPRLSFSPIMPMAKGIEPLSSLQPSNSHGYPETSWEEFESGGQLCRGVGAPPEYFPLPGSNCLGKNVGSSHLKSPRHDTTFEYSSGSPPDDDSQEMRPYLTVHAEEYCPTNVRTRLHYDTEQGRSSVFSRLKKAWDTRRFVGTLEARRTSKTSKARRLSRGQEVFEMYKAQEPVMSLSVDERAIILSQRRDQVEVTKVPKQPRAPGNDEKFESTAATEVNIVTYPMELEVTNDVVAEDSTAKESSEHLFLNFKRRSEIRRLSGENESNIYADSGSDEKTPQKYKRRKLLRPSFGEDDCQNVLGSNKEIVGVKTAVESSKNKIRKCELSPNHLDIDSENRSVCEASLCDVASDKIGKACESSRTGQLDTENKNSSATKGCLADVASYNTESSSENLTTHRKEISNRNLRWFLQKSVVGHAKISDADHATQKRKDEYHMVSEVSVLPTNSRHGEKLMASLKEM